MMHLEWTIILLAISVKFLSRETIYEKKKITNHKGTLLTEKVRLQTADKYFRIQFDIPLQEWDTIKMELRKVFKLTQDPNTFHMPSKILNDDLQRTINWMNSNNLARKLHGQIQPTLSLRPEERISDALATSGFNESSNTYYMENTCEYLLPMAAKPEMKSRILHLGTTIEKLNRGNTDEDEDIEGSGR